MSFLRRFLNNHVLANLTFVLVLLAGVVSYLGMPREQDPSINFNWIQIATAIPGASAEDVEKRVTYKLEDVIRKVQDVRFASSTSRDGISLVLVRFQDMDERTFDKRLTDLRREIQNAQDELPEEALDPEILEITTASGFPTATIAVVGEAYDETLRRSAYLIRKDLERIGGVDRVDAIGLSDPELQVHFDPDRLHRLGVDPVDLADTVQSYFRDMPAGKQSVGADEWLIRLVGTDADPGYLAGLPVVAGAGEVRLGELAEVRRGREKPTFLCSLQGRPAVMLSVIKKEGVNTLELVERIRSFTREREAGTEARGTEVLLIDDQTEVTRNALQIMQTNAVLGLFLVLLTSWLFLGRAIAFLVSIGIPFVLAGTFWVLSALGHTLNVMVLLGVVIVLGMLVDDAVVVVEAIHHRLNRGDDRLAAVFNSLSEVVPPVTTSVLTTMAAFLPLLLLPGIVGKFMGVIPVVVSVALALSLVEAYWMLPAHLLVMRPSDPDSRAHRMRRAANRRIRLIYTRLLLKVLRRPALAFMGLFLIFSLAVGAVVTGKIKRDFFASDAMRVFYVNVEMPAGTALEGTLRKLEEMERIVRSHLDDDELRSTLSYSGQMFTETAPFTEDRYGQVMVSLQPQRNDMRTVDEIMEDMRADLMAVPGTSETTYLRMEGGPPTQPPINVKVRGEELDEILAAVETVREIVKSVPGTMDVRDDWASGSPELRLTHNPGSLQLAGLRPDHVARSLRLFVDGEVVATMQDGGEELDVRVRSRPVELEDVGRLLDNRVATPNGGEIALSDLLLSETREGFSSIKHYNFKRSITIFAEIDDELNDTVSANAAILEAWKTAAAQHPGIDLDFSGELDDIEESLDAMKSLFGLGLLVMYLIIGTQFRSYFQPFMILLTVPMAFTGVIAGLLLTGHPLSLYTLYGVVALTGIAVNASIVLISAANDRLAKGMTPTHAAVFAARRRVIPIVITTVTTIAGLSSLAMGLGGQSLIWGPVAIAIVWGISFSSLLTLFVVPLLYRIFMRVSSKH
jgi:multidrug efflux pump subunit AcrB